jgi:replicative DNA helicase
MNQHIPQFVVSQDASAYASENESTTFKFNDVLDQVVDHYMKELGGREQERGPLTGFHQLDRLLGGLMPGLHVLASRPSMGKTTLMLNIIDYLSIERKLPCLIFSCDLSSYQIIKRMLFSRARQAPAYAFDVKYVPDKSELRRLKQAVDEIGKSSLFIEDSFEYFIEALRNIAMRYKRDEQIGFIAIDHLHLLRSKSIPCEQSQKRQIVGIVAEIKSLARELKVPILLLTGLNRKPESRRGRQLGLPTISDIRFYKTIERYADTITLLYRPSYYVESVEDREPRFNKVEFILCKNLDGTTGIAHSWFDSLLVRFEDVESELADFDE